jgi:hypothetical protein
LARFAFACIALFGILLTGCGGGGGGGAGTAAPPLPTISVQPAGLAVYETQSATFTVTASGSGTLAYQWRKNGTDISGANAESYTTPAVALADNNAAFTVAVTDAGGTAVSAAAVLSVRPAAPTITTAPTPQSVVAGQSATFTVTADGLPTLSLSYQWRKNGQNITGATASSFTTPATLSDNGGQYSVVVTNGAGSATSTTAILTVQAASVGHLVISEVSSCYYYNIDCWLEIHNPTASSVNLGAYQLKSTSVDATNGISNITTFSLPGIAVPADGYVVISGNTRNAVQRGTQIIRLRSGNEVPFWTGSGFMELLSGGATVDFVRFGTSAQTPTTASEWSGASASALPSGPNEYGKSLVRIYPRSADTDTDTATDWSSGNWSTPAGRNDVPASAVDVDGDGIPDSAETAGGTFSGIDLYAMGARSGQRDIFIEVDRMNSTDPGVIPRLESLQKVVAAFAARGMAVHFDAGSAFSAGFSLASFNLGQGSPLVPLEPCVTFNQTTCTLNTSDRRSLYDWKDEYMDLRRRAVFHYLLFGNSQNPDGSNGSSGLAELPGNDLIVSMGGWGFATTPEWILNALINMQASTLMHELGHNLGLRHGGNEDNNYKPNYWSIMNYLYQLNGLDATPAGATAYERWRKERGDGTPGLCDLANSACDAPSQFIMDYSDGSGSALNEASLLEAANVGRGSTGGAYADWDLNDSLTPTAQIKDLDGDLAQSTLYDHDDWGNLILPFARSYAANSGVSSMATVSAPVAAPVANPVTDDRQPVATEIRPSDRFFEELHRAR